MTTERDLIRRLADALEGWLQARDLGGVPPQDGADAALVIKARAYLATTEPAPGPTLGDIHELCAEHEFMLGVDGANEEESAKGLLAIARAVLARWGHRPKPIPLSDRLPGAGDCDAEGRCWVFDQGDAVTEPAWNLTSAADLQDLRQMESEGTLIGLCERWRLAWLPCHALPLPEHT